MYILYSTCFWRGTRWRC